MSRFARRQLRTETIKDAIAAIRAALAEVDRLSAENEDLRARAIPTRLVSADLLSIVADFNDRVETITRTVTPERTGWIHDVDFHDERLSIQSPVFDTLAAALEAAGGSCSMRYARAMTSDELLARLRRDLKDAEERAHAAVTGPLWQLVEAASRFHAAKAALDAAEEAVEAERTKPT